LTDKNQTTLITLNILLEHRLTCFI